MGYIDADLAGRSTRCCDSWKTHAARPVVMCSRMKLLGRRIERGQARHYLGRVFATVRLDDRRLAVYDTRCGAKFFHGSATLRHALRTPFTARWVFDVELIQRLVTARDGVAQLSAADFREVPLRGGRTCQARSCLPLG